MAGGLKIGVLVAGLAFPMSGVAVDQPASTILEDPQFILYRSTDPDHFNLTTVEVPSPRDPKDVSIGDPRYCWEFGRFHAESLTPGVLTVYSDSEGSYNVTVYCEQLFQDPEGNFYCEYTADSK